MAKFRIKPMFLSMSIMWLNVILPPDFTICSWLFLQGNHFLSPAHSTVDVLASWYLSDTPGFLQLVQPVLSAWNYCCSVTWSCPTLGTLRPHGLQYTSFPILHYLPVFAQIHVHRCLECFLPDPYMFCIIISFTLLFKCQAFPDPPT